MYSNENSKEISLRCSSPIRLPDLDCIKISAIENRIGGWNQLVFLELSPIVLTNNCHVNDFEHSLVLSLISKLQMQGISEIGEEIFHKFEIHTFNIQSTQNHLASAKNEMQMTDIAI